MTLSVRTLSAHDADTLQELNNVFGSAFEDPIPYGSRRPGQDYLGRLLRKEHFIAIAAFVDHAVVGGLVAYQLDTFEQDRREIYINDPAVLEAHRRQGIATALIEEL